MAIRGEQLRGRAAMWVVAAGLAVIYLLSTIPTPLYVLYRQKFHFSEITLTLIYAAYVIGTVLTMLFLGRLADQIGRRPVVLASLAVAAAGDVVFLCAAGTAWLFPARILSGLAIALASGACAAWLIDLEPRQDRRRATGRVIASNLLGLGLGGLLAGVLAQFAAWPLRLVYFIFLGLVIPAAWFTWKAEETVSEPKSLAEVSKRPKLGVPRELLGRFVAPAIAAFAVFSLLGFYTALAPSLLSRAFHNHNHAVAGALVGGLFVLGTLAVAVARRVDTNTGLVVSLTLLLPSLGLLVLAEALHSMPTLLIGTALSGVATGLGYRFSLEDVNTMAPENKRSSMVSSYLIACYGGVSLPVVGIGLFGTATNPVLADRVFAGVIALLACVALVVQLVSRKRDK